MSYKFQKNKNYKFGNYTKEEDVNTLTPMWAMRPRAPVVITGERLIEDNILDFKTYLEKNPHQYPINKILYCYEIMSDNTLQKVDEGNPYPKAVIVPDTLKDDFSKDKSPSHWSEQSFQPSNYNPNKDVTELLKKQIEDLMQSVKDRDARLLELQKALLEEKGKIIELQADLTTTKIERDKLEGFIDKYIGDKKDGLADSGISQMLSGLASNPEVQTIIGGLLGSLYNKFSKPNGNGTPTPQIQQQNQQYQNPGVVNENSI